MYSNANREENVPILMKLITNESKVTIDETVLRSNWLTKPESLGDIAIIQLLNIIQKKIKGYLLDEKEISSTSSQKDKEALNKKVEQMIGVINENEMIEKMLELLDSSSNTKKDVAILILCTLSACRSVLNLMLNTSFIQSLINHVNSFKRIKYRNFREHIIATLQLLRRIYVKEIVLRKSYLELGGVQLIYEFLTSGDVDIVQEVLYNVEDLIYVNIIYYLE